MILFFGDPESKVFALETNDELDNFSIEKLNWVLNAPFLNKQTIEKSFIGPKSTMISPWSTNAVEIINNMGILSIVRIEEFLCIKANQTFDVMIQDKYKDLNQDIFKSYKAPDKQTLIHDINEYNDNEGLALDQNEVDYLNNLSKKLNRKLTDSEVYGFSQVNSEHCRHKIFNGRFIIDNNEKEKSLFELIKLTSKKNKNSIVSAYSDNVAFIKGPKISQFYPQKADTSSYYTKKDIDSIISIKAETHNFPTTVEPYNGAATGSGGEIRDRLAGGIGSIPLIGTAVYMTPYSRLNKENLWENGFKARKWKYQTPSEILIKASNGASDFGNCFGQPLICGSLFTFEHSEDDQYLGYDKVIMLAGGVGFGEARQSHKKIPQDGNLIVMLGGDNYRIGMGGASVSSTNTGNYDNSIELNAVQRSNPEMQKRVTNTIRALFESKENPILSIHDHGAGGHLNCFSELVESTGGEIYIDALPLGDPSLSYKEIIGNESQERIGIIIKESDYKIVEKIAKRERTPIYIVGKVTNDGKFRVLDREKKIKSIDLDLKSLFGDTPKKIISDNTISNNFQKIKYDNNNLESYIKSVLKIESVACKDWLTNKVDRCVTGRIAQQQTVGKIQLPLSNCGVVALDYDNFHGVATSIGHSPISGLIDPKKGSINSIAEALTNIIWAPLEDGLKSVSLSANWMWPSGKNGEDSRLYNAVESCSDFAIELGINIPTGKDSLSMVQKYDDTNEVKSPGTVIISASAHCSDIRKVVTPNLKGSEGFIYYINLSNDNYKLGGSSFGQINNKIGNDAPTIKDTNNFKKTFNLIQNLIKEDKILSGHDISSGGLITSLFEMCFTDNSVGMDIDLTTLKEEDIVKILFSENSGIIFQSKSKLNQFFDKEEISFHEIGKVVNSDCLNIKNYDNTYSFNISKYRDIWFSTSYHFDKIQTKNKLARKRFENYKNQPLEFVFPKRFTGKILKNNNKINAAIIREKGSNSEREMAYMMSLSGFNVKDVHMTDIISGRENLEDIKLLVAVGGFSNSDVLGSAKGWAGSFIYNKKAKQTLNNFFNRDDSMSLGVCNGCQLFIELGLINNGHDIKPKMDYNDSGKFECIFTSVKIQESSSIMMKGMEGSNLGVWAAHGEGKFIFPYDESKYIIPATYSYNEYPANPNGSNYNAAMLTSNDGRHLVMMPHLERSIYPHNWAHYPNNRNDEVSPWITAFNNAYNWLKNK